MSETHCKPSKLDVYTKMPWYPETQLLLKDDATLTQLHGKTFAAAKKLPVLKITHQGRN